MARSHSGPSGPNVTSAGTSNTEVGDATWLTRASATRKKVANVLARARLRVGHAGPTFLRARYVAAKAFKSDIEHVSEIRSVAKAKRRKQALVTTPTVRFTVPRISFFSRRFKNKYFSYFILKMKFKDGLSNGLQNRNENSFSLTHLIMIAILAFISGSSLVLSKFFFFSMIYLIN